jgi:hypothetical protein
VLEPPSGVERAAALDAGAGVGDEGPLEARADAVVEQVVRDAIVERRRPDLARLRPVDDEADRPAGPVGAAGEALVEADELLLERRLEGHGAGRGALGAPAVEVRRQQVGQRTAVPGGVCAGRSVKIRVLSPCGPREL